MKTSPKEIVKNFYESNLVENSTILKDFFHPELSLIWTNKGGITVMDYDDMAGFLKEIQRSYAEIRVELSHLLAQENHVTVRYKYYVRTLENPEEEIGIAHFMVIWEIKDRKLYRGYQISQPVSEMDEIKESYKSVMV